MVSKLSSSLTVWVEVEQNGMVSGEPLAGGASSKACARMQEKKRKCWFEGMLSGTLFERRIVGCVHKVS